MATGEWGNRDGTNVFVKERLDELENRRHQLEASRDEVAVLIDEVGRDAVDHKIVAGALANFSDVYDHIPPYKRKELIRLVLQKAVASKDHGIVLALFGKPGNVSEKARDDSRSETSAWLPGLVSQSAMLRDLSELTWRRLRHGRITLVPT